MSFTHLHCHTSFSPDSLNTPELLVQTAKKLKQTSIAVTDHGTMSGAMELYQYATLEKIKPIFGCELYLDFYENPEKNKLFHLTVLARNKTGYKNLVTINNIAHQNIIEKSNGKFPPVIFQNLYDYREGLIVLTGCPSSVLHSIDDEFEALSYVEQLKNIFGADNTFIELMFTYGNENQKILDRCLMAESKFNLPMVITNDAHFTYAWQGKEIHPLSNIAKKGWSYESSELYLKSEEEMREIASNFLIDLKVNEIFSNVEKLVEGIEKFSITEKPKLPKIPENAKEVLFEYFSNLVKLDDNGKYIENFNLEWKVINDMEFLSYFYIMYDIKQFAEKNNIRMYCRGSGAGSYLVYLLGIGPVHPIKHKLSFDRFINYARSDYPDLDLDIDPARRKEIFNYVRERWGMLPVSTFMEYNHKSLVHDIVRVLRKEKGLELPFGLEAEVCEFGQDSDQFKVFCSKHELIEPLYNSLIGTYKTRGRHAAAVASPINVCPIECWGDEPTLAFSESGSGRKDLADSGIIKMDLLGVDVIQLNAKCEELTGIKFTLDLLDKKVYDLISYGNTNGLFQLKSNVAKKLARDIKPSHFDDVSAIIALNRPGPLDSGMAFQYAGFKQNPRKIHEKIDNLLETTYGIIIFQEQVMDLYSTVTGEGAAGRNDARKYLVPKSFKLLDDPKFIKEKDKLRDNFFYKGQLNNFSYEILEKIWNECDTFGRYGFNKAHSDSYAYHLLASAFFKTYYPAEFFTACLSIESFSKEGREKIQEYIYEAVELGIKVSVPNILTSSNQFELKDNTIYFPLHIVTGLGETNAEKLIEYRNKNDISVFSNFVNIPKTILNKATKLNLLLLGSLDNIKGLDETNLSLLDIDLNLYNQLKEDSDVKQQIKTIGFILPSTKLIKLVSKVKDKENYIVGYVSSIKDGQTKTKKKKKIVKLYPFGNSSYMDLEFNLQLGDLVLIYKNMYHMVDSITFVETREKFVNNFGKFVKEK